MGRKGPTRVTANDLAKAGGTTAYIAQLIKRASDGDSEAKEQAASIIASFASQNHGEHCDALYSAGAIPALVKIIKSGGAQAQDHAAAALNAIANGKSEVQQTIVDSGGIAPLVKLLKGGSAKVQCQAASALAAFDANADAHQRAIISAGALPPLVALLKSGSTAAQAAVSQTLANAAACGAKEVHM